MTESEFFAPKMDVLRPNFFLGGDNMYHYYH